MPPTPQQAPPPAQLAPAATARPVEVEGAPAPHMEPAASRLIDPASRPAPAAFALGAARRRSRLKKQQPHLCRPPSAARRRAAARGPLIHWIKSKDLIAAIHAGQHSAVRRPNFLSFEVRGPPGGQGI